MEKMNLYYVADYGAKCDGAANDSEAVQRAIDACHEAGGGTVVIPAGKVVRIATIMLRSYVELYLERGSKLLLSGDPAEYDANPFQHRIRVGIYADKSEFIGVSGYGTIDGNGKSFVTERLPDIYKTSRGRPYVILFKDCNNVTIRDCTIVDGAVWTVDITRCFDVTIHNIRILNDMMMPNSDGIDIDRCQNVRISDCHLECGDDCIVLKSHSYVSKKGSCENITVTNCTMVSKSFAINLGCEVDEPIKNCVFSNCIIRNSHRGIGIHLSEHSNIENVIFSNIIIETKYYPDCWWGAAEPIYVVSIPWTNKDTVGYVKNVMFQNIYCKSENGVIVYGDPTAVIENIVFSGVHVTLDKFGECEGGRFDLRPCEGKDNGFDAGVFTHDTSGFYLEHAKNIKLTNCSVSWGENIPEYFSEPITIKNCEEVDVTQGNRFDELK